MYVAMNIKTYLNINNITLLLIYIYMTIYRNCSKMINNIYQLIYDIFLLLNVTFFYVINIHLNIMWFYF